MNRVKQLMPQMATSEGVWEGIYIYTDVDGKELDRHKSRLTHSFPDSHPDEYHQRNQYEWDDGRVRVGDLATIRVSWHRTEIEGYTPFDIPHATLHEIIQQTLDGSMRSRTWQWFVDRKLIGRTIIHEKRVT